MRSTLLVLASLALVPTGCAAGFRVGGNHYGAGVGGYVGSVPEAVQGPQTYYLPATTPEPPRGLPD